MAEHADFFDAYHRWLGISPKDQPPHHYRLLGIDLFESDLEVIRDAAERQSGHVRRYQLGAHMRLSQKILNEIAVAKGCLTDADKKAAYDRSLRETLQTQPTPPPAVFTELQPQLPPAAVHAPPPPALLVAKELGPKPSRQPRPWWIPWALAAGMACLLLLLMIVYPRRNVRRLAEPADSDSASAGGQTIPLADLQFYELELPAEDQIQELKRSPIDGDFVLDVRETLSAAGVTVDAGGATADGPADVPIRPTIGGLGGYDLSIFAPTAAGGRSTGSDVSGSSAATNGGVGTGFAGRDREHRQALVGSYGGTRQTERAVAAALNWLARHQGRDGSWSFGKFGAQCKDDTCSGLGASDANAAATAVALLSFLAAGQTHESRGPYRTNIYNALYWMLKHQARDGNLYAKSSQKMYTHGLATIAMCEAYGLTNDKGLGQAAQAAVNYILSAQHPTTGGWRYQPGDEGDTSVLAWQVAALKSAQMASLNVNPAALAGAKHFLDLCAVGNYKGQFAYQPGGGPTVSMTAAGLLCRQWLGMKPDDPAMREGVQVIMQQLPKPNQRPLYFWYYATQVMHNVPGQSWDDWNRAMRRALLDTQIKNGCAAGSWDPDRPARAGMLSEQGGRILITAMSTLILEIYYRYLPVCKLSSYKLSVE